MIGALISRNARHQDREREQLRELFAKQRDLSKQVRNLVDVMEQGGLDAMRPVQDRFAKRQDELDQLNRLIALKRRALDKPVAAVSPEKAEAFSAALRAKLRDADNPSFQRAYLRLMLDKVVVGKKSVRISGSKAVLAHQLSAENPLAPSLAPTLMDEWRARRDCSERLFRHNRAAVEFAESGGQRDVKVAKKVWPRRAIGPPCRVRPVGPRNHRRSDHQAASAPSAAADRTRLL